jgi:hypothetical protein
MKLLFLTLTFIALLSRGIQCQTAENGLNCSEFRNGRFILINEDPLMKGEIIRKGNTQIIKNLITNTETVETIRWLSDCVYVIDEKEKPDSVKLSVEIIKITGDTAYIQGSYPNIKYKPVLKIVRVK